MPRRVVDPETGAILENVPDEMSAEEAIASSRGAQENFGRQSLLSEQLGGASVGAGEVTDPMLRFLTGRANLISEKAAVIKERLPEADIQIIAEPTTGEQKIMLRLPGRRDYIEYDEEGFTAAGDLVDALGGITTGPVIMSILGGIGGGLAGGPLGAYAGSVAGAGLGSLGESAAAGVGEQENPLDVAARETALAAVFGAAGAAAGPALKGGARLLGRGSGVASAATTPVEILQGFPPMSPLEQIPLLGSLARQGRRMDPFSQTATQDIFEGTAASIRAEVDRIAPQGIESLAMGELRALTERWAKELDSAAGKRMSKAAVGREAREGLLAFQTAQRELADRLYDTVRQNAADATFHAERAQVVATNIKRGIRAAGKPYQVTLPGGQTAKVTPKIRVSEVDPDLQNLVNAITKLDPKIRGGEGLANQFDQIRQLRTRARELMYLEDKQQSRLATMLHDALVDVMENPTGGTPTFRESLRKANTAVRVTEEVLDKSQTRAMLKKFANRPVEFGRYILQPNRPTMVRAVRGILMRENPRAWEGVRRGFVDSMLEDPTKIGRKLDQLDSTSRRLLLNAGEEKILRRYGDRMGLVWGTPLARVVGREQEALGRQAVSALMRRDSDALRQLVNEVGGKDTAMGRLMQAGIFTHVLEKGTEIRGGRMLVNKQMLRTVVEDLRRTGRLDAVLDENNMRRLESIEGYVAMLPDTITQGEGIQIGALSARLATGGWAGAITKAARTVMLGRIISMGPKVSPTMEAAGKGMEMAGNTLSRLNRVMPSLAIALDQIARDNEELAGGLSEDELVDRVPFTEEQIDEVMRQALMD